MSNQDSNLTGFTFGFEEPRRSLAQISNPSVENSPSALPRAAYISANAYSDISVLMSGTDISGFRDSLPALDIADSETGQGSINSPTAREEQAASEIRQNSSIEQGSPDGPISWPEFVGIATTSNVPPPPLSYGPRTLFSNMLGASVPARAGPGMVSPRREETNSINSHLLLHPEVIVPRWQPDAEVTLCPICRTQFSFFVRKHHCRKCGRVVCNSCSPHRITIPYQFIVQPPSLDPILSSPGSNTDLNVDRARSGSATITHLGGGQRVRLCNPCVPDPNIAPPPPDAANDNRYHRNRAASTSPRSQSISVSTNSRPADEEGFLRFVRNFQHIQPGQGNTSFERPRQRGNRSRPNSLFADFQAGVPHSAVQAGESRLVARSRSTTIANSNDNNSSTGVAVSGSSSRGDGRSGSQYVATTNSYNPQSMSRPMAPRDNPQQLRGQHNSRSAPRLAEEDECPVCHRELPSALLPNSEYQRAEHITQCIENVLESPSSPRRTLAPAQAPARSTAGAHSTSNLPSFPTIPSSSSPAPSISTPAPIANTPEARAQAREQAHAAVMAAAVQASSGSSSNIRRTGLFPYKASEKDCVDDAECTICMEEYEVGVSMARLECFCRFHLHCIRQWFGTHPGQCPVHQHGDGGY